MTPKNPSSLSSASTSIEITLGTGHPVNLKVFGANDMLTDGDNILQNEAYRALVAGLNPPLLRFPGGSHASFWEWETGRYIPVDEITRLWPATNHNWMLLHVDRTNALPAGTHAPVRIAACAKDLGVDMQWVPNMTTRHEDQPAFFESLKKAGFEVKYVEMDNEAYFWGAEFGEDRKGDIYARRVDKLSAAIRALYPRIEIGIVTAEDDLFEEDNPQVKHLDSRPRQWNEALIKPEYKDSYDAVILHHYLMKKGRLDPYQTDRDRAAAFLAYPQATLERAGRILKQRFPGKKIWITEYNVIAFYPQFAGDSVSDKWMTARRDTGWAALYQAAFWLTGLCNPDTIGILNHHSLAGIDIGWGLGDPVDIQSGKLSKAGQLFAHLTHLARTHRTMHPLVLDGSRDLGVTIEGEASVSAIYGAALTTETKSTLLIMNRSEAVQPVTLKTGLSGGRATLTVYHADEPEPGPDRVLVHYKSGQPVWEQGPMKPTRSEATVSDDGQLPVDLPPFSLTIVACGG